MGNSSLDEVGEYNEISSPEDVEDEVLIKVLQKGKDKRKKKSKKKCMG